MELLNLTLFGGLPVQEDDLLEGGGESFRLQGILLVLVVKWEEIVQERIRVGGRTLA